MDLVTRLKVPSHLPQDLDSESQYQEEMKNFLLDSMDISHTEETKVGNEFVRGISGGEKNGHQSLNASLAMDLSCAGTAAPRDLMQALLWTTRNEIYDLFDKVLVLDGGEQVYNGPLKEVRPFMEDLGFVCGDGANVTDYLTGVTVPTERQVRDGYEHTFLRNAKMLPAEYGKSNARSKMMSEYDYPSTTICQQRTEDFEQAVGAEKDQCLPKKNTTTAGLATQIRACALSLYQIIWGVKATFLIKQVSTLAQTLMSGYLFYNDSDSSSGLFIKSGSLFFSLLYNSLLLMSEVTDSFTGQPILIKHKSFAFLHPAATCIAQIAAELPTLIFQISIFPVVLYFMVGLTNSASAFFTYWILVFATTMVSR